MRVLNIIIPLCFFLNGCVITGSNPADPYEPVNREVYKFNRAFDATFLKPPAKLYVKLIPNWTRKGIHNFYDNLHTPATIANDVLQACWQDAITDFWRMVINTTLGGLGFIDAAQQMGIPFHKNDLGLTFAKWGDRDSPYLMLPLIGPSTIRDGMGFVYDVALFSPYPYIWPSALSWTLVGVRYLDVRSQLFDTERLMQEALDPYTFVRDAYLQHRNAIIGINTPSNDSQKVESELYVDE